MSDIVEYRDGGAVAEYMPPVMTIEQALQRYEILRALTGRVLRDGHDYGVIPGTGKGGDNRKVLLKPGAEKLCSFFGLCPVFEEDRASVVDFAAGLFHFSYTCALLRNAQRVLVDGRAVVQGAIVGTGTGSANSREKKYRRGARLCPQCNAPAIKRSKYPPRGSDATPGWYCHDREGGCGANFAHDEPLITEQAVTTDPNAAADLVNTLQKMAQKRALVAATLIATNASDLFAQDPDDERPPADEAAAPPAEEEDPGRVVLQTVRNTEAIWVKDGRCSAGTLLNHLQAEGVKAGLPPAVAADVARWPAAELEKVPGLCRAFGRELLDRVRQSEVKTILALVAGLGHDWDGVCNTMDYPAGTKPQDLNAAQRAELLRILREEADDQKRRAQEA